MRFYLILDQLEEEEGYQTLVVERIQSAESENYAKLGTFELDLIDAQDLDPIADKSFIEKYKGKEIFFTVLRNEYAKSLERILNVKTFKKMVIEEL